MAESGVRSSDGSCRIEDVIAGRVAERSAEWFPHLHFPTVRVSTLSARPKCSLYVVRLGDDSRAPRILAKVRRDSPSGAPGADIGGRPRLHAVPTSAAEYTTLEYSGLCSILNVFGSSDPAFGVIRPLDYLPEEAAILMDYLPGRTLRDAFISESRLMVGTRAGGRRRTTGAAWHSAGAWLRRFHDSAPGASLPVQQPTRYDVIDRFHDYHAFLSRRLGSAKSVDIALQGAELAASSLPECLPLVVGHGDFAARNMFAGDAGRITVFDPMPRWLLPRYEDLGRFTIGLRLLGLQLSSHGAAYSRDHLNRRESDFLSGYFVDGDMPSAQVRCYQLLILLDKWAALVEAQARSRGWRARLRATSVLPVHEYIGREARRLLALANNERG